MSGIVSAQATGIGQTLFEDPQRLHGIEARLSRQFPVASYRPWPIVRVMASNYLAFSLTLKQ